MQTFLNLVQRICECALRLADCPPGCEVLTPRIESADEGTRHFVTWCRVVQHLTDGRLQIEVPQEGEDEESAPVCDANPQTCSDFVLAAVVDAPPVVVQKRRVAENTQRVKKHTNNCTKL